jgi:class 3 adenylate cyclase
VVTCSRCGQENPDGARFCNGCAAALAADEEGPLEERKVVTILFADLVGFTSRAERMDPEEVRSLLRPITRACVTSWSGSAARWRSSSATP